jgi:hypothetical protein
VRLEYLFVAKTIVDNSLASSVASSAYSAISVLAECDLSIIRLSPPLSELHALYEFSMRPPMIELRSPVNASVLSVLLNISIQTCSDVLYSHDSWP